MTTTTILESIAVESFTFGLSICYFVLSVVIGVQILRLICFRHKIFSFQFGFMFMCLLECLLRTVYFFFYQFWQNMELKIGIALYWFPINIQFATFLFLVLFFVAVIHKKTWEESWKKKATFLFIFVNITLLALFLVSLFFGVRTMALQPINGPRLPPWINKARELFSAGVFFILMAVVAGYGHRVRRLMLNAKNQIPQLQSISVTKLTTVVILLVVIFTSRSIVDFVCVLSDDCSFNLGEYKIHMPTFGNLMDNWVEDLLTCFLYFVWEIAPAIIVLLLFYKIPSASPRPVIKANNSTPLNYPRLFKSPLPFVNNPEDLGQSAQVFRNPLRYDSDDEAGSLMGSVASSGMNYGSFTYIPYSTSSSLNSD